MLKRLLVVVLSVLGVSPCLAGTERNGPAPICATGFERPDKHGLYQQLKGHDKLDIVEGKGVGGGSALRATYEGFPEGSRRIVSDFKLPKRMGEATLVYDVKFDNNFQFTKGGKLHGLGPDRKITGGNKMKPDGWSARAMWDRSGLYSYVYSQNKDGKYGERPDDRLKFDLPKNEYISVSIYVKINHPVDKANGVVRIYVNGKGVSEQNGIQFRSVEGEKTGISQLLFSTFHGGNKPSYAPKDKDGNYTDVHAYFDNLAVYEGLRVREKPGG